MKRLKATTAALALALLLAAVANAAETTRDDYVAKVEPICELNTKANERILVGVRNEVRTGKLRPAAAKLAQASAALKKTLAQLRAVPKPKADKARLEEWLAHLKTEADLFDLAARKLKAGEKIEAQRMVVKLTVNANKANAVVLPFEFRYCMLEPSKFT
jgi:hypothetical protein